MNIRLYLHDYIADTLGCFGDVRDVVNRIIDAGIGGAFDLENLPVSPRDGKVGRYDINVTNEEFLEQREIRGATSKQLSLRRIIYWFVDNEAWELLGWEPINSVVKKQEIKYITRATRIADELVKLARETPAPLTKHVLTAVKAIREVLNGTRE